MDTCDIYAVREYVKGLKNADELLDMVSAAEDDQELKLTKGEMLYPEVTYTANLMQERENASL